jgi:hypothetical protein
MKAMRRNQLGNSLLKYYAFLSIFSLEGTPRRGLPGGDAQEGTPIKI